MSYMSERDDIPAAGGMQDELLTMLNELLEAERAGARVALASIKDPPSSDYAKLMQNVRADEARWCAMLVRQIRRLGGTPSRKCGAFFGKAMAITDPMERLVFLNRGQSWVARKLETLPARVTDRGLREDLRAMAVNHRSNIEHVERLLDGKQG